MAKLNCWEFKKCGREPGGAKAEELGVCPSATEKRLDGAHGGTNAGRACWVVTATLCGGQEQGSFGKKFRNCSVCDFYNIVKEEEKPHFKHSIVLMEQLRS